MDDTFVLTINTSSDAFREDRWGELRRILLAVVDRLESEVPEGTLRDANGNTVGLYGFEPGGGRG